jgi:hypothetical protein
MKKNIEKMASTAIATWTQQSVSLFGEKSNFNSKKYSTIQAVRLQRALAFKWNIHDIVLTPDKIGKKYVSSLFGEKNWMVKFLLKDADRHAYCIWNILLHTKKDVNQDR